MNPADKREAAIALERRILRLMCSGELHAQAFAGVLSELAGYKWLLAEHQIVWEALLRVPQGSERLRELLPTEAARLGFPDVEWRDYFSRWSATLKGLQGFNAEDAEGRREHGECGNSKVSGADALDFVTLVRELKGLVQE